MGVSAALKRFSSTTDRVKRGKDPFLDSQKGRLPMFYTYVLRTLQTVALMQSYGNIA